MKKEIIQKYKELLVKRFSFTELLNVGEDTIRYDFFCALTDIEKLQPFEINLEFAMNESAYEKRKSSSKRKQKPQIDLVIPKLNMSVEFALFRQNSNDEGVINKTARTVKMLNDMIRLGLDSFYTKRTGYFVCLADKKMLDHQLRSKIIGKFPSNYKITKRIIDEQIDTKTNAFDHRFLKKMNSLNLDVYSKLIFDEEIYASKLKLETRVLVWEIKTESSK